MSLFSVRPLLSFVSSNLAKSLEQNSRSSSSDGFFIVGCCGGLRDGARSKFMFMFTCLYFMNSLSLLFMISNILFFCRSWFTLCKIGKHPVEFGWLSIEVFSVFRSQKEDFVQFLQLLCSLEEFGGVFFRVRSIF